VRQRLQANALTGHGNARRSVCAPTAAAFIVTQTAPERRWTMKAHSCRLAVESLEDRSVPSTVAYADFNKDGHMDMAAITGPKIITVSLANPDGSYTVSATLTAPKNQTFNDVGVRDVNGDGNLDVYASSPAGGDWMYSDLWLGNGDGAFGSPTTNKWGHNLYKLDF
jgi:hypothetical protein